MIDDLVSLMTQCVAMLIMVNNTTLSEFTVPTDFTPHLE